MLRWILSRAASSNWWVIIYLIHQVSISSDWHKDAFNWIKVTELISPDFNYLDKTFLYILCREKIHQLLIQWQADVFHEPILFLRAVSVHSRKPWFLRSLGSHIFKFIAYMLISFPCKEVMVWPLFEMLTL